MNKIGSVEDQTKETAKFPGELTFIFALVFAVIGALLGWHSVFESDFIGKSFHAIEGLILIGSVGMLIGLSIDNWLSKRMRRILFMRKRRKR